MPPISPNLAVNKLVLVIKWETWDIVRFILQEASPNARSEINSPLPRLYRISRSPLSGSGYATSRSNFTAYPSELYFGEFLVKDKAETLPIVCLPWGGHRSATHKIDAKIVIKEEKGKRIEEKLKIFCVNLCGVR